MMQNVQAGSRFIGALTRGGPGGMPRPIEMHAHDPRRFVSDMLAWVHQACPIFVLAFNTMGLDVLGM